MKRKLMMALAVSSMVLVGCGEDKSVKESAEATASETSELSTLNQKVSYIIGLNMGQNLKNDEVEVDIKALNMALEDAMAGRESRLTEEVIQQSMTAFQEMLQAKRAESVALVADANAKEGAEFLAANGLEEGVVTTESGLQYRVITEGEGAKPAATDTVSVHYRGTLLDGTEFDSSYKRGEPVSFPVGKVISGWTEALQLMGEGSKWELFIPSDLAYGPGGANPNIGPNATLKFEVELLKASVE
jgi:FKBP-type peptidyl-prolyl cis-trans isomerase